MLKSENVEKTMTAKKVTHAAALKFAINYMKDDTTASEYVEDLQNLLETFVKRSTERKPGKREKETIARREKIITYLQDHPDEELCNEEIGHKIFNTVHGCGNYEPVLRQTIKAGIVDKRKVGDYTYYSIHVADEVKEEA